MIFVVCTKCSQAIRAIDTPPDIALKDIPAELRGACPACGGDMQFAEERTSGGREVRDLTFEEMYYWLTVGALPEERQTDAATVSRTLTGAVIQQVKLAPLVGGGTVLCSLILGDGTRVYLGASPEGALVYRMAGKVSEKL